MDFFTVEVLTLTGLVRKHVLFLIDIATRRVEIAGIVDEPWAAWVVQRARELTDPIDGFLANMRYLIHDRMPVFTERFREILRSAGVDSIKLPAMSPNLNAFAERWVRSVKSECLDQIVIVSERQLRHLLAEYVEHYHLELTHQGLNNCIPMREPSADDTAPAPIIRKKRLGGLLSYYYRKAA